MKPIEIEIKTLKEHHLHMWELVELQLHKAFTALETFDKNLALEVISREKMVNAQELVVDHHCENFIALFNPVAVDLRLVISLLKINNNLERIGDFAESIALFVSYHQKNKPSAELFKKLELKKMVDASLLMFSIARMAWEKEDCNTANQVFGIDDTIDTINRNSVGVLTEHIQAHPENTEAMLYVLSMIRKIERIGDRVSNIAEDICFYLDAKELRHQKKN